MAIKGARSEDRRITPHLIVRNLEAAVEFYQRALGAVELYRSPLPGGKGLHAHLKIGDSVVMVTSEADPEEMRTMGMEVHLRSPQSLGGTSMLLEVFVDDVDAAYKRAVDAGAEPTLPLSDCFWGDRYGWVRDPYGHLWALAQVLEELAPEEVARRMEEHMSQMKNEA
jgi:uncharacterized glyoxalase superfamily protein PhnB